MGMHPRKGSLSRKLRRHAKLLFSVFAAALILMALVIGIVFSSFQKIALNSLAKQDSEFAAQIDTLGQFIENMIQQYGLQIFYNPMVAGLLGEDDVSEMERVYDMRTLNAYDRSRSFIDSVMVYNKYNDYIYSTDSHLLSAPARDFPDKSAVEFFQDLNVETRMAPLRRTAFRGEAQEKRYFSFLFYETTYMDEPQGSVLMLNVDETWYLENLTRLYGQDSCVLMDETGGLLTATSPEVQAYLPLFAEDIISQGDSGGNYMMKKDGVRDIVCLYSRIKSSGWYCMRIMPLETCLPGLIRLRDGISVGIGVSFALLVLAIAATLLYLYLPISQLQRAMQRTGSDAADPSRQIDRLVQESSAYQSAHTLRSLLEGHCAAAAEPLPPPLTLLLLKDGSADAIQELLLAQAPGSLVDRQQNCDVVLLTGKSALQSRELCGKLATDCGCRCFCGIPRQDPSQLPGCYQILLELSLQQFWYSGQRILFEKDFSCTKLLPEETKALPEEILSALKNRNLERAEELWQQLLQELQGSSHADQLLLFHKLASLLESALPSLTPLVSDEFFRNLQDLSQLNDRFLSAFRQIVEFYQRQRFDHSSDPQTNKTLRTII